MKGLFVTSFQAWSEANLAEDVLQHGPEQELEMYDLDRFDQLALAGELAQDRAGTGESDLMHDAAMAERLSNIAREDDEDRLARRVREQQDLDAALVLGMSPEALDREIERLEARIRSHSETRNRLRKEALALSPHSLDVIGTAGRRHS